MKRTLGLFLTIMIMTIVLAGCEEFGSQKNNETQTLKTEKIENFNENTGSQDVRELQTSTTMTEISINPIEESNFNLKPLELLGYYIDEENRVTVDDKGWEACTPDVFREYMFGTWEGGNRILGELENGFLIIDDSENNSRYNLKFACKYLKKGDTIIFYVTNYQSDAAILWLDINEPNIMYKTAINGNYLYVVTEEYFNKSDNPNNGINIFTKTDAPVNEPENNYMSRLRLYEIMQEYEIDFETLFIIRHTIYDAEERPHYFIMDGGFNTFPIYLISEATDKLVFKSEMMSGYGDAYIDVTYTIERKNGKWDRTIEVEHEKNIEEQDGIEFDLIEEIKCLNSPINLSETDIEELKRYKSLEIILNEETDLSFLEELTQLENLYLYQGEMHIIISEIETEYIKSYEFLYKLKNLKSFSMEGAMINGEMIVFDLNNLNNLYNLDNLESFNFRHLNLIYTGDKILKNIKKVKIYESEINIDDFSIFLPNLQELELVGGDFNFSSFLNCKKLTSFSLTYGMRYTEHLSNLSSLPLLEKLKLTYMVNITDISFILDIKGLKELQITEGDFTQEQIDEIKLTFPDCEIIVYSTG